MLAGSLGLSSLYEILTRLGRESAMNLIASDAVRKLKDFSIRLMSLHLQQSKSGFAVQGFQGQSRHPVLPGL